MVLPDQAHIGGKLIDDYNVKEAHKWGIGYNSDMSGFAPDAVLTSAMWNWGPLYKRIVEEVRAGDIIAFGGLEEIRISDTIAAALINEPTRMRSRFPMATPPG